MTKIMMILLTAVAFLIAPPAYAGAKKTADALYATLDQIDAAKISNPSPALQNSIKEAASLIGGYWKIPRHEVYDKASKVYDVLIAETKGKVDISKPDWLN